MRSRRATRFDLRGVIALLCVHALSMGLAISQSLSFADGAALARERAETHLVFVHGSDWNPYGELLMGEVWRTDLVNDMAANAGLVLSDVDVLQGADDDARVANERRNADWKGTGLSTHPAFIAFDSQGRLLGSRQGLDLPRNAAQARICVLEFIACLRLRAELDESLAKVHAEGDVERELELLLSRDSLPLERAPDLLERIRAIDTDEARRAATRIGFPDWFGLVRQATSEATGGEGAQTEERLRAMLEEPAYTDDQRDGVVRPGERIPTLGGARRAGGESFSRRVEGASRRSDGDSRKAHVPQPLRWAIPGFRLGRAPRRRGKQALDHRGSAADPGTRNVATEVDPHRRRRATDRGCTTARWRGGHRLRGRGG